MKCYKHPKANAVGVCSECGKGVCSKCSVEVSEKIYCKPCTDKVFGEKKEVKEEQKVSIVQEAPKANNSSLRNSVLGQSSFAWMLGILGWFFLPWLFWGLGIVFGYMALSKASENPDVFSKRDVIVCGVGAIANLIFLVWWGITLINILP